MSKIKGHTPGPWELVDAARPRIYHKEDVIATVEPDHVGKLACDRNARLIAAAPTMYDLLSAAYNALGDCEKALGGDMPRLAELRGEIRAAIARATGKGE